MIKRDEKGWTINVDILALYVVVLVLVIVFAIKAIRWAVSS